MDVLIYLFAAGIALAGALATLAIWAPRSTGIRSIAVAVTAMFIPLSYLVYSAVLGKPKPIGHEWWRSQVESATVLGTSLDEGEAIYLWLMLEGESEPRYYVLPWAKRLAERLQEATDDAIASHARIEIDWPFSARSPENLGELNVEVAPPPLRPGKPLPPPARIFNPRGQSI